MLNEDNTQLEDKLFFVIFSRVSTENQAERGSSLKVQTEAMEEAVTRFGGKIVANYGGQEHATPDFEHIKMEQLIRDSHLPFGKRKWNAVIFYDHSRWSRDNRKASYYIEILKSNGIRFFTVSQEWILTNPEHRLILGINTVTNEYHANVQTEKSMKSRIARAKEGKFTAGQPPFGRRRDKETGKLHIIKKDKELIATAARLYLEEGKGFIKIGKILKKSHSVIQRALLYDAGDIYEQEFKSERFGIDESIPTKIPPTLDGETWTLIKEEAAKRREYHPGVVKSERLLSGVLRCDHCRRMLRVQEQKTRKNGKTYTYIYYRHPGGTCRWFSVVKGELTEDLVMKSLIELLKDSQKFKEALLAPHPSEGQKKSLERELSVLDDTIEIIEKGEKNLINKIEKGVKINGLQERATKLCKDKEELLNRREEIKNRLSNLPKENEIESYRKLLLKQIENMDLENLTFKEKRELIKMFCRGTDIFGRPCGVYVANSPERYEYELSFCLTVLLGDAMGYISDNDPDIDITNDEEAVNVEELRLKPLMDSFNAYMGSH